MPSVNKVIVIGHAGRDPETKYLPNGSAVTNLSIACNEQWKDGSGQKQEHVEWVNVTAFGKPAEIVGEYVRKGDPVYFEGRLRTEKWQDKEGKDRYSTKVYASSVQLLGGKRGESRGEQHEPQRGGSAHDDDSDPPF